MTGRISCGGYWELRRFLIQQGLWSQRYLAFSMPLRLSGSEDTSASGLEKRLADVGKVNADVLASGADDKHCRTVEFFAGKVAIVIYDAARLKEIGEDKFKRPPIAPSEYVAMVIVPKVQEAVVG